ncbi:MAG TPA: DUF1559 domain-containing protein [Urbifossiella sp.]|jgi:hypothetical protein|nr:DUF1559 domain-containing protein [Urbifossiella sp.]
MTLSTWTIRLGWLALLGVAAGILVPAVQRVREAAARSKCHCHLKCLSCALYARQDCYGPSPGTVPLPLVPVDRRLSWVVDALPFMEQGPAYKLFDPTVAADAGPNRAAAEARLPHLVCPSSGKSPTPVTHYVGIAGVGTDAADLPGKHPRAGAFGYDRKTALNALTFADGTSNTLLLVETAHEPGHWAVGGPATVRPFIPGAGPYIGAGRPFGGYHPGDAGLLPVRGGLVTVAMADASIRTIRGDIAPAVLEALATAAGQEPLPAEW